MEAWKNKGIAFDMLKKYKEAIRCFDKVLEIDPNCVDTWNNKGITLRKLKRYNKAIRCYDKVLNIDSKCMNA